METKLPNDSLQSALENRRSVREFADEPVSRTHLDQILWAAQGISGPDGLRTAPSAHALHPLQLRLSVGVVDGLDNGLYAVSPDGELSLIHQDDPRRPLQAAAVGDQPWVAQSAVVLTICADMVGPTRAFADQAPYGRRGPAYVYIEAGAAAQNAMLQSTALGLGSVLVAGFEDAATAEVLRLSAPYEPILHVCIGHPAG